MASFPWSVLGLDGPADETTIRRAYASRLKIVRPDVDAAGFQRLVQARDAALRSIAPPPAQPADFQLTKPPQPAPRPDPPPPSPEPQRERMVAQPYVQPPEKPETPAIRAPAPAVSIDLHDGELKTPPPDTPKPIEIELVRNARSLPESSRQLPPQPPPDTSKPVEIELNQNARSLPESPLQLPQQPPPDTSKPIGIELNVNLISLPVLSRQLPQPLPPVTVDVDPPTPPITVRDTVPPPTVVRDTISPPTRAVTADPDAVVRLLSAFVDAWSTKRTLPPVAPILTLLGEQSIAAHQKLEIEALRTVGTLFDKGLFERTMFKARQKAARSLILGLDDDFAWANNDRRLYTMMPQATADRFTQRLRLVREWDKTGTIPNLRPASRRTARSDRMAIGVFAFAVITIFRVLLSLPSSPKYTPQDLSRFSSALPLPSPNNIATHFSQGVAYDNAGQFDRAIQEYDKAISFDPNYTDAFYNRGLDYANAGQFDRAIQDYNQVLRINPGHTDGLIARGVAYDAKGQYDLAIEDYDKAIRLTPKSALAYVDRGLAYANKNQYDRAIKDYDQAIGLEPNNSDAWYYRGQAKRANGNLVAGDADIARARQLNPALPPDPAAQQAPSNADLPSLPARK